ncbi:uncharacterized protein GGS22DRAFT_92893 [Annulohypoxylon maeteangense]|uniref:uncharacterized protein n=1 Tax=Annulohypoxylon maeteangense TaxID=1927788 RepID=UPI002007F2D1|nr:uncharacterized protein GGS22DRAFT_92893 [Annulohypoxylon maeteangense]KAI0888061.1 hypothetical protein GGS22DRAFT_92893 [Annulohypoxylon maeteangense]
MSNRKLMSLEAALEEERKEVENLIAMQPRRPASVDHRSPSPFTSPRSPVRSMLDIGDRFTNAPRSPQPQAPVRSMLDIDTRPLPQLRSMLDITSPSTNVPTSTHTSPTLSYKALASDNSSRNRSMSDAASNPVLDLNPRSPPPMSLSNTRNNDPTSAYKFHDILPTNVGQALPVKRGSASTMRPNSSIGEALRGADLSNLVLPGDHNRFPRKNNKSKSPNNRFNLRSNSPFGNPSGRNQQQEVITLNNGQVMDMNNAYRKLSDANLLYGGSTLASLARKRQESEGHGRIEKDNLSPYGELLPDESDDDVANSSDEELHRGRKLTTRAESRDQSSPDDGTTAAKSLLAAIEDERKHVNATQPQYRSLFDEPEITVTGPTGEKGRQSKSVVQPSTSFDQDPMSGTQTPIDPELDADVDAIRAAQRLQLSLTPILSTPEVHRTLRILYRGEFNKIQREAEEEHRRLRKYLVATDLSDESTHALEWAIGTVLRDGDTLIAMYCMDEEASGSVDAANMVPDEPKAMKEQAMAISAISKSMSTRPQNRTASPGPFKMQGSSMSPHIRAIDVSSSNNPSPAPSARGKSRLQEERDRAVLDITERVSKLLRKTQLQVRVIVEVIHCKNPKHLITEVIDILNPTLVILGSRGRSALKGTLLGSFSNYLVTKSSVPVMVARKRLRKKSKYQPPPMKQVNNLANPSARSLETARVD